MYALKSAQRLSRAVKVEWEDGLTAQFTYVWLRDNGYKRPSLLHLDLHAKPEAVKNTDENLSVVWPPFLQAQYSSQFLREHALVKPRKIACPAGKTVMKVPWRVQERPNDNNSNHMAAMIWSDRAVECGTVWPHFERVPSMITVETARPNGQIYVVDALAACAAMAQQFPEQFTFLLENPVEYEDGLFKATHRTIEVQNGKVVSAVFNNDLRSSEITTEALDMMYLSLKTLNKLVCEHTTTLLLQPNEMLVVDNAQAFLGCPPQSDRRLFLRLFH